MSDHANEDELSFTRVFDAPRELVFRCMIEPEHLTLGGIKVEARPGGVFESVMVHDADGGEYRLRVIYDEVVEPERLVWTDPDSGMKTTSTFTDLGDSRTEIHIHQASVPEAFRGPEAQAGFLTSLDRFDAYLGKLQAETEGTP